MNTAWGELRIIVSLVVVLLCATQCAPTSATERDAKLPTARGGRVVPGSVLLSNTGQPRDAAVVEQSTLPRPLLAPLAVLDNPDKPAPPSPTDPTPKEPAPSEPKTDEVPPETQADLKSIDQMPLPTVAEILKGPPVDWLVLKTLKVIPVEPVSPRPNTLDEMNRKLKESLTGPVTGPKGDELRAQRLLLNYLPVNLPGEPQVDYRIHLRYLREIVHHEDQVLRRTDELIREKNAPDAHQLVAYMERTAPSWPGLAERKDRLLLLTAQLKSKGGDHETALVLLEQLWQRSPQFPDFSNQLGLVMEAALKTCAAAEEYRRGRHYLNRLARLDKSHPTLLKWSKQWQGEATRLVENAVAAESAGDWARAVDALERAARVWPLSIANAPPGQSLAMVYARIGARYQRLRVGVLAPHAGAGGIIDPPWETPLPTIASAQPEPAAPPSDRAAEPLPLTALSEDVAWRRRRLTDTRWFEPSRFEQQSMRFESPLFADWEPTDLGHGLRLKLADIRSAQGRMLVRSHMLADQIAKKIDPELPDYSARLQAAISRVIVRSPVELEVQFASAPLRPDALLKDFPLRLPVETGSASELQASASEYPFRFDASHKGPGQRFVRTLEPPAQGLDQRGIAEVIERPFPTHEHAVQALLRDEVQMLADVPAWVAGLFEGKKDFAVQTLAVPRTHFLQFHPGSRALANRHLRRALAYSLPKAEIFSSAFQREAVSAGRLSSGVVPFDSYGYNKQVDPHGHDLLLAATLAKAAQRDLGGRLPVLKMHVPDEPRAREAARQMIREWKRIGIDVAFVDNAFDGPPSGKSERGPAWDLRYERQRLDEPALDLWHTITVSERTQTSEVRPFVPWVRQTLLSFDGAANFTSTQRQLREAHAQLWTECLVIPLWEPAEYRILRKNIRIPSTSPMFPYHGIEQWRIEPWYATN